jgi:hypothetical protein
VRFARENRRAAMNWLGWLGWILAGALGLIVVVAVIYYIRIMWEIVFSR